MLRDLAPLDYEVADARYLKLLDAVLGVFDAKRSRTISVETRVEAADALGQSGDPRLEPGHPERYVLIPAGSFWMGAQNIAPSQPNYDPEAADTEGPVMVVTLNAYRIGRYPVTVGEYLRFLESGGYADPRYWTADSQGAGRRRTGGRSSSGFRIGRSSASPGTRPWPMPLGRRYAALGGRVGARPAGDGGTEIPLGERAARPHALQLRDERRSSHPGRRLPTRGRPRGDA